VGIHDQNHLVWMEEAYLHIMRKEIVEPEKKEGQYKLVKLF
jgi:hypothetical protein